MPLLGQCLQVVAEGLDSQAKNETAALTASVASVASSL